ncbi:MAG: hypothetical protein WC755_09860 [Candidatus Woesearchaeota archaeon]|jgi:hypothetical protein
MFRFFKNKKIESDINIETIKSKLIQTQEGLIKEYNSPVKDYILMKNYKDYIVELKLQIEKMEHNNK